MIKGEYDQLNQMVGNHVCAQCGGHLTVAWHEEQSCYYVKCGKCDECKAMTTVMSATKLDKTNQREIVDSSASSNDSRLNGSRTRAIQPQANTLGGVPGTDLATGELLEMATLKALVDYAHRYQLDPRRGHVAIMYGHPYITIDGYLYHAYKQGTPFTIASRPLNDEERRSCQVNDGDHAWTADVIRMDTGAKVTGVGIVTKDEMEEPSKKDKTRLAHPVVAGHPWQLAQKRAEWQALRRAFPIGESEQEEAE